MERYGYMGSRKVMIDGCAPCEWLWLDAGELMAMARMHVRHDKRMERFEMSARPADLVGLTTTARATEGRLARALRLAPRNEAGAIDREALEKWLERACSLCKEFGR